MDYRKLKPGRRVKKMQGAMLMEVLVSLLIFSCGMLAIAGLQAESFKNSGDVQYRAEAIHLVNTYVGKIKSTTPPAVDGGAAVVAGNFEAGGTEFDLFQNEVNGSLPGAGAPVVTFIADPNLPAGTRRVDITVTWQPPGGKYAGEDVSRRYTQASIIGNN
jgi:type IV pilus assembly protein PilV